MTLKDAANEVLRLIDDGSYQADGREVSFAAEQRFAIENTRLYKPDELEQLRAQVIDGKPPAISVTDGTTQLIAQSMAEKVGVANRPLGLLNFASARNPGGGFLNGAKAQEEDICRCSGLYPCLLQCMEYYEANRRQDSLLYTDHAIFSPSVPFFKTRGTGDLLANPFVASVITAPAPNSGPFLQANPGQTDVLERTFIRRWENVLCIARDRGIRRLLLGAWGCGAFGGDPVMAASTAKEAIKRFGAAVDEIVFAIPGNGRQSKANLDAFRTVFNLGSAEHPTSLPAD